MDLETEKMIVGRFFTSNRRTRSIYELSHPELRRDFLFTKMKRYLDEQYMVAVTDHIEDPRQIYEILKDRGAPEDCYSLFFGRAEGIDGCTSTLTKALSAIVFQGPGLISCIHGKLAFFEDEFAYQANKNRYLLIRK